MMSHRKSESRWLETMLLQLLVGGALDLLHRQKPSPKPGIMSLFPELIAPPFSLFKLALEIVPQQCPNHAAQHSRFSWCAPGSGLQSCIAQCFIGTYETGRHILAVATQAA